MRAPFLLITIVASLVATALPAAMPGQAAPSIDPQAKAYLLAALDTIQATTIRADTIRWQVVRDSALFFAAGAVKPPDTYAAISWALHRANKHSFLQAKAPGAASELIMEKLGYLHVPQRGGAAVALADSLHSAIATLSSSGVCGWIVDLRDNGGGNMWPMLAGIGPLLGDSLVGSFGTANEASFWYYQHGVSGLWRHGGQLDTLSKITVSLTQLSERYPPLAVLLDSGTGSSGEAIAIAFSGRPNTRSFGSATAGFATVNRGAKLADGANMVVTTGHNTDRTGKRFLDQVVPDVSIPSPPSGWPTPRDRVARTAAAWLLASPMCNRSR
ncbi:MAG: S41 family peptidase [Gemmatimonadota bacterium]